MRNAKIRVSTNIHREHEVSGKPELSGKLFTWNLRILMRDSILRRALTDVTFYDIYTKFSQVSGKCFSKVSFISLASQQGLFALYSLPCIVLEIQTYSSHCGNITGILIMVTHDTCGQEVHLTHWKLRFYSRQDFIGKNKHFGHYKQHNYLYSLHCYHCMLVFSCCWCLLAGKSTLTSSRPKIKWNQNTGPTYMLIRLVCCLAHFSNFCRFLWQDGIFNTNSRTDSLFWLFGGRRVHP